MKDCAPRVLFFVPVPNPEKGLTGAVLGSQTVREAASAVFDTQIVPMQHSAIRDSKTGVSPGIVWRSIADHGQSLRDLRTAVREREDQPLTVYMVANSSLAASLRDYTSMLTVSGLRPDARFVLHSRNGNFFFPKGGLQRAVRRRMLERADRIICLSRRLLPSTAELETLLPGLTEKLYVIPNTIDQALVPDAEQLAATHQRSGPLRVLYLSNFIPSKGYKILGEAARLLASEGLANAFRFVFRGKWISEDQRRAFVGLFDPVLLENGMIDVGGPLWDRGAVQAELLASDAFCLPTRYPPEAMPRSIIEAMACRCAIIANDHAAIADLVTDRRGGLLCKDIGARDIADFLRTTDRTALSAMGDASLAHFSENFAQAIHDRRVVEVLR